MENLFEKKKREGAREEKKHTCSLSFSFSVASSLSLSLSSGTSVCGAIPLVVGLVSVSSILSSLPSPGAAASPTPPSAGNPSFFGVVVISTDLLLCLAPIFPLFASLAPSARLSLLLALSGCCNQVSCVQ